MRPDPPSQMRHPPVQWLALSLRSHRKSPGWVEPWGACAGGRDGPRTGLRGALHRLLIGAAALIMALLLGATAGAQDLQPVPALTARVIDQTATLDAAQQAALESRLADFEQRAGPQIVVLMVSTTQPEDIAAYAQRVGETWKIGRREVGDGLLIVVAKDDRRLWIAPAKALEGAVPDLAARQIARDVITPAFREGNYFGGLERGLQALIGRIGGEGLPAPEAGTPRGTGDQAGRLEELLIFFFVAVPIVAAVLSAMLGRKLGALATAGVAGGLAGWVTQSLLLGLAAGAVALVLVGVFGLGAAVRRIGRHRGGPVVFGGGSWGGMGGFSGGGVGRGGGGGFGGFSSGGGGDFGGGGAGGSW
jgi:uncharacterized protein